MLVNNQRALLNAGHSIATNSRGEYRIWNLPAGRYFVTAIPPTARVQIADMRAPDRELRRPPRYYPGVNDLALAQTISVSPGVEIPGIDIGLATEPAGTFVVDVVNPTAMATSNVDVAWHPPEVDASDGVSARRADEAPDGRFVMRAVPVGRHIVTARANVRGSPGQHPPPLDGRYAFDDLPPGAYFVIAAPIDWNPALETDRLQELEPTAPRITLRAGEEGRLDLRTVSSGFGMTGH